MSRIIHFAQYATLLCISLLVLTPVGSPVSAAEAPPAPQETIEPVPETPPTAVPPAPHATREFRFTGVAAGHHGPYWMPGGYAGRVGSPYYYSPSHLGTVVPTAPPPGYLVAPAYTYGWHHGWTTAGAAWPGGDPYEAHFGPGFHRYGDFGHYRFPYYSYRRPWYFPGHPSFNRDTNLAW